MNFKVLHDINDDKIYINLDKIIYIQPSGKGTTNITFVDRFCIEVKENPMQIITN